MGRNRLGYVSSSNTGTVSILTTDPTYGTATGGSNSNITVSSVNYTLLTFTSDGNLVVSTAGLFDILMFGAGGSGGAGGASTRGGGGGGAGSMFTTTIYLSAGTVAVTIGVGGVAVIDTSGIKGTSTVLAGVATGFGGSGGNFQSMASAALLLSIGRGCAGGGTVTNTIGFVDTDETNFAFKGGTSADNNTGGGGGGVTAAGANNSSNTGGAGGAGFQVNTFIGGSSLFKGGGGGGGGSTAGGAGGSSVGGAGGGSNAAGSTAAANTGSGGGGANGTGGGGGSFGKGGNGGSGILFVRFKV